MDFRPEIQQIPHEIWPIWGLKSGRFQIKFGGFHMKSCGFHEIWQISWNWVDFMKLSRFHLKSTEFHEIRYLPNELGSHGPICSCKWRYAVCQCVTMSDSILMEWCIVSKTFLVLRKGFWYFPLADPGFGQGGGGSGPPV